MNAVEPPEPKSTSQEKAPRQGRVVAAFLVAPLAPALVAALIQGSLVWVVLFAPFAYTFSAVGLPVFLVCRKRGWLSVWHIVCVSALLGMLVSPLFPGSLPSWSDVRAFAGYGALAGLVFWLVAFSTIFGTSTQNGGA